MMKAFTFISSFVFLFSVAFAQSKPEFGHYCGNVYVQKGTKLQLTDMERRLICGDDKADQIGKPWSEIPAKQAQFFLASFLQSRGYHRPNFSVEGTRLLVNTGEITKLTSFEMTGGPPEWNPPRRRLIRGRPLTPGLLNDLESWTTRQLADEGYACAEVNGFADPETGLARVEIKPGAKKPILDVIDKTDVDLSPGVADRHNAFRIGDDYSEQLVQLSRRRLLEDGLFQAVSLSHDCYPNGVIIKRDAVLGPKREFRIGVGGDTDVGPKVRVRAKQIRIGNTASNAEASISASFVRQEALTLGRWFYSRTRVRDHLEPSIRFSRQEIERPEGGEIETRAWTLGVSHVWQRELRTGQAEARFGPSWNNSETVRGVGPENTTLVFLETRLRWTDHDSEYFEQSPRQGSRFEVQLLRSQDDWGAPFSATRAMIQGQTLWNLPEFDPPLLVLGIRYSIGTTTTQRGITSEDLPTEFRFFGGGNDSLRGFDREELPRGPAGGLSEATLGAEARLYRALFKMVGPFIFTDVGRFGLRSAKLDSPTYISPGSGVRWESPVGVFRVFLAYGMAIARPEGYVGHDGKLRFGLTFGEEF